MRSRRPERRVKSEGVDGEEEPRGHAGQVRRPPGWVGGPVEAQESGENLQDLGRAKTIPRCTGHRTEELVAEKGRVGAVSGEDGAGSGPAPKRKRASVGGTARR